MDAGRLENFIPLVGRGAEPEEARLVQEHLDGCIACREELAYGRSSPLP